MTDEEFERLAREFLSARARRDALLAMAREQPECAEHARASAALAQERMDRAQAEAEELTCPEPELKWLVRAAVAATIFLVLSTVYQLMR